MNPLVLIQQSTDPIVILLVLVGGLFAKNYLNSLKMDTVYKTLLVSTVFVIMYGAIKYVSKTFIMEKDLTRFFISYCVATSLYELLLKVFLDKLSNLLGSKTGAQQ